MKAAAKRLERGAQPRPIYLAQSLSAKGTHGKPKEFLDGRGNAAGSVRSKSRCRKSIALLKEEWWATDLRQVFRQKHALVRAARSPASFDVDQSGRPDAAQ
jgi:hypothetical protein